MSLTILFLHGWHSVVGGVKPTHLAQAGHRVLNPALDDDDFALALRTAQAEFDRHSPHVIVGSSRGGAAALNLQSVRLRLYSSAPPGKDGARLEFSKPTQSSCIADWTTSFHSKTP